MESTFRLTSLHLIHIWSTQHTPNGSRTSPKMPFLQSNLKWVFTSLHVHFAECLPWKKWCLKQPKKRDIHRKSLKHPVHCNSRTIRPQQIFTTLFHLAMKSCICLANLHGIVVDWNSYDSNGFYKHVLLLSSSFSKTKQCCYCMFH